MFDRASLKLGLDKAVLQSMSGRDNSLGGGAGGGVSCPNDLESKWGLKSFSHVNYAYLIFKEGCLFSDSTCDKYHLFHKLTLAGYEIFQFSCFIIKSLHK